MAGKPVNETELRKKAGVSSYESDMIRSSLERLATKSDSEIGRTCFNNGVHLSICLRKKSLKKYQMTL